MKKLKWKWKLISICVVIIAIVAGNLYLLLKEESKADRTAYISKWQVVKEGDVTKTFDTKGITKAAEEHYVYYDGTRGALTSLLVNKGDKVESGTELFTYGTQQLDEERMEVEAEIVQIENEITSVKNQIDDLEDISVSSSNHTYSSSNSSEVNVEVNMDVSPIVDGELQKAIVDAEAELSKLEAKLITYEKKLARLDEQIMDMAVSSTVEGQVIAINENGENPVVTIVSSALDVEGTLSEKQMKQVKEGMTVNMYSSLHNNTYTGTIKQIIEYPQEEIGLNDEKDAVYSFVVQFDDEESEELLIGAKLDLTVVVDEVLDVPVVPASTTFKEGKKTKVYQLTSSGQVETVAIKKGLTFDGTVEVKEGLQVGDIIVKTPSNVEVANTAYITPLKTTKIQKKAITQLTKRQMVKYTLLGVL